MRDIAANMHAYFSTHCVKPADQSLFSWQNQALINVPGNLTSGGIADADSIGTRLDLRLGKCQRNGNITILADSTQEGMETVTTTVAVSALINGLIFARLRAMLNE